MIMKIKEEDKDLNYWKKNCEEDYLHTPISVLRYITKLESKVNSVVLDDVSSCCGNCDETIINEPYCESCYDLANSRDNT